MRAIAAISLMLIAPCVGLLCGQNPVSPNLDDEDFHVYRDAPRLLLTPQRLRLLQRERERQSPRWEQFDALMSGGAASTTSAAEPGFAWALYYQVTRQPAAAGKAIEWALGDAPDASDLRQLALVFDWCGPALTPAQSDRLAAKIEQGAVAYLPATSADKAPAYSPPSPWPTACRTRAPPS